ncbi:MAG TPA: 3'(2'),5'-bisphosphate nucleotidase CysQ [Acetobacteraceae bacterium]|jgi:3'(2'), 5'-bisphosphate nucleotidase|nr:3'(2'),5'-bisphosphate nucleotidase CysQ [Acetobacteraceae bacterium]
MHEKDDAALLSLVAALVERAATAIMEIRKRGFAVERKSDATPVTEADRTAEALIVAGLRETTPDIPVIAEEEVAAGRATDAARCFWLVDPLDGTREFAAGRDEFAVNIGLVRNGRPYLGAVALPATGETYLGIVGTGAWRQDPSGRREPIHTRPPPASGLDVMASRHYADDPRLAEYLKGRKIASLTNIGSAMKFCRLAEGKADLYPRLGRTMEWDTAAPQAVLEAAGGHVLTFEGTPLAYGKKGWENPPFICTGE